MDILLVEPSYYTRYPPLGLMKLASYHRSRGDNVKLVRGVNRELDYDPDHIKITSLFTYAWKPVHEVIEFYHKSFPDAEITVGGIYASMMPDRIKSHYPFVNVHVGLHEEAERYMPAYDILEDVDKWRDWNGSILFTSRGCIRNCPYCIVPKIEGKIRSVITDINDFIYPGHKRVILWDNNFLASPYWKIILESLHDTGLKVDFNQGLDVRLIDEEKANMLADLKMPIIRMAYDHPGEKNAVYNAVTLLEDCGMRKRNMLFYTLFNFYDINHPYFDTPETFFNIVKDTIEIGCVSYPMRYEPLDSLKKNRFISLYWTREQLEAIADARRVIGYGGAFPPYDGLIGKFKNAKSFDDAFKLRSIKKDQEIDGHSAPSSESKSGICQS